MKISAGRDAFYLVRCIRRMEAGLDCHIDARAVPGSSLRRSESFQSRTPFRSI
jgi:hypothetical protein